MKRAFRLASGVAIALAAPALMLAGCEKIKAIQAPAAQGGKADFSVVVAMGTSISAGTQSDGLVVHHQTRSFAYLFAQQAGAASFTIPSISADGFPPLLRIVSLGPPPVISNAGRTQGQPTNLAQPTAYHNLGVPFAVLPDVLDASNYYNPALTPRDIFFQYIVRNRGTILTEVSSLQPTFITFEYGSNEVLRSVTSGGLLGVLLSSAQFAGLLDATLAAVATVAPSAGIAIVNVPGVDVIPFANTFPPVVDSAGVLVGLIANEDGGTKRLGPGDRVLLTGGTALAGGMGFPLGTTSYVTGAPGTGAPLADQFVLTASEAAPIVQAVSEYNAAIASQAAGRDLALLDLNGLLRKAATEGFFYQGTRYTPEFVTGGLFSLDGVHPTDLAHGFLCNALIEAVNAKFGSTIPLVDLSRVASGTSSRARPAHERGLLPYIEDSEATFRKAFPWLAELPEAVAAR
jgi:hypothetical protein